MTPSGWWALEVATGYPQLMLVAIDNGSDRAIYAGPASSYYSFVVPAEERMTDETWRKKLTSAPARPPFVTRYRAD